MMEKKERRKGKQEAIMGKQKGHRKLRREDRGKLAGSGQDGGQGTS